MGHFARSRCCFRFNDAEWNSRVSRVGSNEDLRGAPMMLCEEWGFASRCLSGLRSRSLPAQSFEQYRKMTAPRLRDSCLPTKKCVGKIPKRFWNPMMSLLLISQQCGDGFSREWKQQCWAVRVMWTWMRSTQWFVWCRCCFWSCLMLLCRRTPSYAIRSALAEVAKRLRSRGRSGD